MSLVIKNIEVAYDTRTVFSDLSLSVNPGEILAVVGHNGAGKTTLLKSIVGLVKLKAGSIECDGQDITNCSCKKTSDAGIRMLPADYRGIFSSRPVLENLKVSSSPELYSDRKALNDQIDFCLSVFPALREKLRQPAGNLSGGQQQMVAMSNVLMGKPKYLLLDEPSIGLSPNLVQDILREVKRMTKENNMAAVIVEQNAKVALEAADRVAAIRTGRIIHNGPASEITMDRLWELF